MALYKGKHARAIGTDKINQGAKIKATIECLQDVQWAIAKAANDKLRHGSEPLPPA